MTLLGPPLCTDNTGEVGITENLQETEKLRGKKTQHSFTKPGMEKKERAKEQGKAKKGREEKKKNNLQNRRIHQREPKCSNMGNQSKNHNLTYTSFEK